MKFEDIWTYKQGKGFVTSYAKLLCWVHEISEEELRKMIREHEDLQFEILKLIMGMKNQVSDLIGKYKKEASE